VKTSWRLEAPQIILIAVMFAYSYVVWRADPEKQSPAGTQPADDE
jgi:hypothetical protein